MDALNIEIHRFLAEPSRAQQILTAVASALQSEDPFEPLTLDTLNAYFQMAAGTITGTFPAAVAAEETAQAAFAIPTIYDQETADAYAIRLLKAARAI